MMLANVERIEQRLTNQQTLDSVARTETADVAYTVTNAASSAVQEIPTWIRCKMAALVLGVSELHIRVLARDGVLEMCDSADGRMIKTSSLQRIQSQSYEAQREFASFAADMDSLRKKIVEQIAG